jgi:glycerate 2-kinase
LKNLQWAIQMIAIKNKAQLVENGETQRNQKARKLALESLETAINAVDPKQILKSKLLLENSTLKVEEHTFNLEKLKNVYVIGGGKASGSMAEAIEQILGKRVTDGLVNVPYGSRNKTSRIKLHGASHPVPDEAGVDGTRSMLNMVEHAERNDLIICLISGGGSSLMPLPRGGISLADKREMTQSLLKSGATINEVNTVRKHISDFKGGWLAKKAYPATILNLILSDVVGDPLDFIASGPTVPDSTTFRDAVGVLKKYGLWAGAPESIRHVLSEGEKGLIPETPKADDVAFKKVCNVVVGNNRSSSLAACEQLKSAGLNTLLLTATLEGEARHIGVMLASIAREVSVSGNPVQRPAGMVAGGETTVTVTGKGVGGRNQELVLAAASKLRESDGIVLASLSTDGVDGPTDAAGAVVDGKTVMRALKMGLNPEKFLVENNSYRFFSRLGDLVFTGPTGTNVNDVSVIVVL